MASQPQTSEDFGSFSEGIRRRIKTSPENGELHMALGMTLQQQDMQNHNGGINQPEALKAYENAIRLGVPDSSKVSLYLNTGILLTTMSRPIEAVDIYNTILTTLLPTDKERVGLLSNRAAAANALGRLRDAENDFLAVLEIDPKYCRAISGLVQIVKDDKDSAVSWSFLASLMHDTLTSIELDLEKSGGIEYRKALHSSLTSSKDPAVPLRQLFKKLSGRDPSTDFSSLFLQAATIHFGLNSAIDAALKLKTTYSSVEVSLEEAWKHLVLGNAFDLARRVAYDRSAEERQVSTYSSVFKEGFWPQDVGSQSKVPVFVVGLMRSGSTLVESVLAAHSQVFGMGEDSVFNGQLPVIRDGVVSAIGTGSGQALKDAVNKFASDVVKGMKGKVPKAKRGAIKRVVDKMLFNFRNIGFIHMLFPNAVIIHTVRGFEDCLMSNYKHKFEDNGLEWSFSIHDLVHFFACYRRMMRHWDEVLPGRLLTVQYEHMVTAPKQSMMRILEHCGIAWEDNVLNFQDTERVVHTFSQQQVKQGIYSTAIKGSKKYQGQLRPFLQSSPFWPELEGEVDRLNWVTGDLSGEQWTPTPEDHQPTEDQQRVSHTRSLNEPPQTCSAVESIARLTKEKMEAVLVEDYLKAASLKDQITALKNTCEKDRELIATQSKEGFQSEDFSDILALLPPLLKPLDLSTN